jgi:predicted SAM-dependent methyltransferase
VRLNLGCGEDVKRGYVNLDIREIPGAIKCDVSSPILMARYSGATEIVAFDILEHFDRKKARECLAMWVGLLAPQGVIGVRCPEIRHAVKIAPDDEWLELLIYGGQDYPENFHKCGFTTAMLAKLLTVAGCKVMRSSTSMAGNLEMWAQKAI